MNLKNLVPGIQNSFRTDYSMEKIQRNFETAKRQIGRGRMEPSGFQLVRLRNRSAAYLIVGKLEKHASGIRISYEIRMHQILQWVFLLSLPLSILLFFQRETFTILLQLYTMPLLIRLLVHVSIVSAGIWLAHRLFKADMEQVDKLLQQAFAGEADRFQKS